MVGRQRCVFRGEEVVWNKAKASDATARLPGYILAPLLPALGLRGDHLTLAATYVRIKGVKENISSSQWVQALNYLRHTKGKCLQWDPKNMWYTVSKQVELEILYILIKLLLS